MAAVHRPTRADQDGRHAGGPAPPRAQHDASPDTASRVRQPTPRSFASTRFARRVCGRPGAKAFVGTAPRIRSALHGPDRTSRWSPGSRSAHLALANRDRSSPACLPSLSAWFSGDERSDEMSLREGDCRTVVSAANKRDATPIRCGADPDRYGRQEVGQSSLSSRPSVVDGTSTISVAVRTRRLRDMSAAGSRPTKRG